MTEGRKRIYSPYFIVPGVIGFITDIGLGLAFHKDIAVPNVSTASVGAFLGGAALYSAFLVGSAYFSETYADSTTRAGRVKRGIGQVGGGALIGLVAGIVPAVIATTFVS